MLSSLVVFSSIVEVLADENVDDQDDDHGGDEGPAYDQEVFVVSEEQRFAGGTIRSMIVRCAKNLKDSFGLNTIICSVFMYRIFWNRQVELIIH